uniref:Heat shock protein 20 n=1 Tax=Acanthamoeba healyi TaxID=65661 RepID=A0A7G7P0D0_9EUKA|nr:heat shock protein 20 [Acanthamoeba healyi]
MSLLGFTDPWSDMRDMQRQMDRLMNRFDRDLTSDVPLLTGGDVGERALGPIGAGQLARWNPHMDVRETDKSLILHAELPGCNKEDIKLSIDNNRLVLQGEKKTHKKEEGENWVRKERFEGTFKRTLQLPRGVDANQIQANYNNGVLEIVVPKPEDMPKRQLIDIKTGEGLKEKEKEQVPISGERGQK